MEEIKDQDNIRTPLTWVKVHYINESPTLCANAWKKSPGLEHLTVPQRSHSGGLGDRRTGGSHVLCISAMFPFSRFYADVVLR